MNGIIKRLMATAATPDRLERTMFDRYNGEPGDKSLIAQYEAPNPIVLRPDRPIRMVLTAFDALTTDGSGEQDLELSHSIVEAPQSADLYLYEDGQRVSYEAIDYENDVVTYDDGGSSATIGAYYISDADCDVEIEKQAPSSQGRVSERVFEDTLSLLHQRDQDEQPRYFDVGSSPLERVVPTDWKINVYADSDVYGVTFDDEETQSTARNAVISLPYKQGQSEIEGLSRAVAHDIVDRS